MTAVAVFEEFVTDTVGATTYTFSGADIGPAASDRIVVVTCHTEGGASVSSATIGGSTADIHIQSNNGNVVTTIISLLVTTGTTADIVVTWNTSTLRCTIGIWSLTGAEEVVVDTDSAAAASGTAQTLTVTIPAEGTAISGDSHGTGTTPTTWGGSTVRFNESPGGNSQFSGSDTVATGSLRTDHDITTSHANSSQPIACATVVWEEVAAGETASGAPSITLPTASGAAQVTNTATGAPSLPLPTASGAAEVINTATGAVSIPLITASGASFSCSQKLAPDTIAAIVNLSGTVADIDEPVDTPDGNWLLQA